MSADTASNGPSKAEWGSSRSVICGPNALYMFLKAYDRQPSLQEFFREVDPGDRGLSLAGLRDASTRYGLPAEVRRCSYEQLLAGRPLPLIALMRSGPEIPGASDGHYVLVFDVDVEGVRLVDGTTCQQERYPRDVFCRNWKGYVVVSAESQPNWLLLLTSSVVAWVLIIWLILRQNRAGNHTSRLAKLEVPEDAIAT
jgi:ABC-type bacteriocin/lantibiotic exporter with double-glycine peptidase domain